MTSTTTGRELEYREVPLEQLTPHAQNPRGPFTRESVEDLADSIAAQGVVTPLLVRPLGAGYQVVAGHRRLVAAELAGLKVVPVIVRPMDDRTVLKVQLTENAGREDLNPLQRAEAYARYLKETGETQEQLAGSLGLTQGTVSALVALLDLPPAAHKLVADGTITAAHGRELRRLANHPQQLAEVLGWIRSAGQQGQPPSSRAVRNWADQSLEELERRDQERMRIAAEAQAAAKAKAAGKGRAEGKRSAAEAKAAAAASLASRISRERHLEIAVRATAIAKEAVALGRRYKLPPGILLELARCTCRGSTPDVEFGGPNLTFDTCRTLQVALVGRLPGKWRRHGSAGNPLAAYDSLDATAAQAWLGLWAWLVTRTTGLERQLEAAAKRRLAAKAKAKARK